MSLFKIIDLGYGNQFYCYPVGKDYYQEDDFLIDEIRREKDEH